MALAPKVSQPLSGVSWWRGGVFGWRGGVLGIFGFSWGSLAPLDPLGNDWTP